MNTHLQISRRQRQHTQRIIKIFRVNGIDGKRRDLPEIASLCNFLSRNTVWNLLRLLLHFRRKFQRKTILYQNRIHLRIILSRATQHTDYFTLWIFCIRQPLGNFRHRLIAIICTIQSRKRDKDIHPVPHIIRSQKSKFSTHLHRTRKFMS